MHEDKITSRPLAIGKRQTSKIEDAIARRIQEKKSEEAERWLHENMKGKPFGYEW